MNKLKEDIAAVIKYSQGLDVDLDVNELVELWAEAKKDFIKLFGGEYIYECPEEIQFELSEAAKEARLEEFISTISNVYENYELAHFLSQNSQDFYSNKLSKDYLRGYCKTIKKGTKIIKAFKEFESDTETLRRLQDTASILIQENKVKGKLCLSVHPLDFLSSSENTYHWHSCHNLRGDYRAGNLSYMLDNVTMICYLKGEESAKLPSFPESVPWNSKKWRTLIFMHPLNMHMFAGRSYPFSSFEGLEAIRSTICSLNPYRFNFSTWSNYWFDAVGNKSLDTNNIVYRGRVYEDTFLIKDGKNSMAYNDLLNSTVYTKPYISINYQTSYHLTKDESAIPMTIGKEIPCVCCGHGIVEDSGSMICTDCELEYGTELNDNIGVCACCGRRIIVNDAMEVESYDFVCNECYEENCFVCDRCGCVYYNEHQYWDKSRGRIICPSCKDELEWYENDYEEEESEEEENGSEGNCSENESN